MLPRIRNSALQAVDTTCFLFQLRESHGDPLSEGGRWARVQGTAEIIGAIILGLALCPTWYRHSLNRS